MESSYKCYISVVVDGPILLFSCSQLCECSIVPLSTLHWPEGGRCQCRGQRGQPERPQEPYSMTLPRSNGAGWERGETRHGNHGEEAGAGLGRGSSGGKVPECPTWGYSVPPSDRSRYDSPFGQAGARQELGKFPYLEGTSGNLPAHAG